MPMRFGKTSLDTDFKSSTAMLSIWTSSFFRQTCALRTGQKAGGNVHYERFQDEVIAGLLSNEQFESAFLTAQ